MSPSDPEQNGRFLGNRMMIEIILGRHLTPDEQKKLFSKSTKTVEVELFGKPLPFDIRSLKT